MAEDLRVSRAGSAQDYPLAAVPETERKGLGSLAPVLLGFTFFSATMWGGGQLGVAYSFWPLMGAIVAGNLLLGSYAAILSVIAQRSGLSTVLMARYSFGDYGSKWVDFVLGFTQIGWYAWGSAATAELLVKLTALPESLTPWLILLFGIAFSSTAYVGYRGLEVLSKVAVPAMLLLMLWSLGIATRDAGGFSGILSIAPTQSLGFGAALTIVFGTFASGGTQATNWTRYARTPGAAAWSALWAFFIGNGLMIFVGAYGAMVYQEADLVLVMATQGLAAAAVVLLLLNIWTTQDNTIYNFSVAGCNMFRSEKRRLFVAGGAGISLIMSWLGIYNYLIPYLTLLGTFIPPIGGVLIADFFLVRKGRYPTLGAPLPRFNYAGLLTYALASAVAYYSPGIPPLNGILAAVVLYPLLVWFFDRMGYPQVQQQAA